MLCILLLATFSTTLTLHTGSNEVFPIGPILCNRLCDETFGCETYTYSTSKLTCTLCNGPHDNDSIQFNLKNNMATICGLRVQESAPHLRQILTNSGNKICIETKYSVCEEKTADANFHDSTERHLLIVPETENISHPLILNVVDMHVTDFPPIKVKMITNVHYIPWRRSLIFIGSPDTLYENVIGVDEAKVFVSNISCMALAVDETIQDIFVTTNNPKQILRITAQNGHQQVITNLKFLSTSLTLFPKESKLFIIQNDFVASISYDGITKKVLMISKEDKFMDFVYFDRNTNFLYLSRESGIFRENVVEKKSIEMLYRNSPGGRYVMYVISERVFLAAGRRLYTLVNGTLELVEDVNYDVNVHTISMCELIEFD